MKAAKKEAENTINMKRGKPDENTASANKKKPGILEEETGDRPVVLLDDIFSELDETRQKHLVQNFKDYQMIVTSTNVPAEMTVNKSL